MFSLRHGTWTLLSRAIREKGVGGAQVITPEGMHKSPGGLDKNSSSGTGGLGTEILPFLESSVTRMLQIRDYSLWSLFHVSGPEVVCLWWENRFLLVSLVYKRLFFFFLICFHKDIKSKQHFKLKITQQDICRPLFKYRYLLRLK